MEDNGVSASAGQVAARFSKGLSQFLSLILDAAGDGYYRRHLLALPIWEVSWQFLADPLPAQGQYRLDITATGYEEWHLAAVQLVLEQQPLLSEIARIDNGFTALLAPRR